MYKSLDENDAEHSFHLAMMACILAEHAKEEINILHVIKMVLIHDIVEIDAGDTYCYDTVGYQDKAEREQKARDRIFALLPDDQKLEYCALWDEFEARITPESKFANALDRIQPMLLNYQKGGISWKKHNIHAEQVEQRNLPITKDGSHAIYELAQEIIASAKQEGMLL